MGLPSDIIALFVCLDLFAAHFFLVYPLCFICLSISLSVSLYFSLSVSLFLSSYVQIL